MKRNHDKAKQYKINIQRILGKIIQKENKNMNNDDSAQETNYDIEEYRRYFTF